MNSFFNENKESCFLEGEEAHHCSVVMRGRVGDTILVLNGKGSIQTAHLKSISRKQCAYEIIQETTSSVKKFGLEIAVAPIKNVSRLEWIVEKSVELGVDSLCFLNTQRTEKTSINVARLSKKAIAAMKQSGNSFLPQLSEIMPFESYVRATKTAQKLLASQHAPHHISSCVEAEKSTAILIGPEGDFTEKELQLAIENNFVKVKISSHTLRTETACIVATSIINYLNQR